MRFYCIEHKPAPAPVAGLRRAAPDAPRPRATARPPSGARRRVRSTHDDRVRAMCPNCFIEVSATGECGVCGAVA